MIPACGVDKETSTRVDIGRVTVSHPLSTEGVQSWQRTFYRGCRGGGAKGERSSISRCCVNTDSQLVLSKEAGEDGMRWREERKAS